MRKEKEVNFDGLDDKQKWEICKDLITLFFCDKQFTWGGPIPASKLHSNRNVRRVMNTTISEGVSKFYAAVWDEWPNAQQRLVDVLNQCAKRHIPKQFAAGIMLMYFNLCEGVQIA